MSNLEERVKHLEHDVGDIKTTLARIETKLDTFATGESLHKEVGGLRVEMHSLLRQQIMWSVGTILAAAGLVFAIMRFLPA
ncbi:hypothetical protein [Halomonas elongata]|uniref:hypothetical protein n=1 Tax=Halomonas elongata TaxID=2746 RepID=UPI0040347CD7